MPNNLARSDTFVAMVKNSFGSSKIVIYKIQEIENESLQSDLIQPILIEWEGKEKECTHINYVFMNDKWYLVLGFIGFCNVYCEDGSKKYYQSGQEGDLMSPVFLSSCVGYCRPEGGEIREYLMMGTSAGEIY